ncbi:MAG: SDR family NAD(P)-dependent oxidoreductase, partial [Lysobacteraceae bacterium]
MSVVLVTGASRGIGRAIVARFAREGCTVFACARGQDGLDALRADLPDVECRACDMRDEGAVDALALEVQARHGA